MKERQKERHKRKNEQKQRKNDNKNERKKERKKDRKNKISEGRNNDTAPGKKKVKITESKSTS